MKDINKALFVCCLFVLIFTIFFGNMFKGGDYPSHLIKAKEGCGNLDQNPNIGWTTESCEMYAPLFHFIAKPFAFHENAFFYFVLFLFGIVTPMLVFFISKNWLSVIFYFTVTNYFYFIADGIFAQGLAIILLLSIFCFKDWRIQLGIVLLSIFSHGSGFYLVLIGFLIINFKKGFLENGFLGCSATFGQNKPAIFEEQVLDLTTHGSALTFGEVLIFFVKIFPLPFLVFSVWYSINKRYKIELLLMALVCFVGGFWISHRIFYVIPLLLIPALTNFAIDLKGKTRIVFWLLVVASFVYLFGGWINFKTCIELFG